MLLERVRMVLMGLLPVMLNRAHAGQDAKKLQPSTAVFTLQQELRKFCKKKIGNKSPNFDKPLSYGFEVFTLSLGVF